MCIRTQIDASVRHKHFAVVFRVYPEYNQMWDLADTGLVNVYSMMLPDPMYVISGPDLQYHVMSRVLQQYHRALLYSNQNLSKHSWQKFNEILNAWVLATISSPGSIDMSSHTARIFERIYLGACSARSQSTYDW